MFKEKLKGFIAGILVTVLLSSAISAFAINIDVAMGGIKIYWDGIEKKLTDANGDKVEPLIYNGTTYVPVRAMANLMGKEVSWNQQEQAVIVGEKPTAKTTSIIDMQDKVNYGHNTIYTGKDATFKLKDKVVQCENLLHPRGTQVLKSHRAQTMYVLNNNYTKLVGKAVIPYETVGSSDEGTLIFYSVENDGTETEIKRIELKQTQEPVDVNINLTGVKNLKIEYWRYDFEAIAFYDVYFLSK